MKYKKNPRVLIIGEWDFAACGYFLSLAVNQHTGSKARSIRYHPSTLGFPYDLQAPDDDALRDLWKRADVVHIHDDYRPLPAGLQDKPTVVTYHGSLYRASPKKYDDQARARGWVQTAATLDLCATLGRRWMPDTRPDLSKYVNRSPAFKACHAPTKRKIKGTDAVLMACRKTVDLDLIENVPWEQALVRKGQCWLTIDQFQLGYGCNAIEAWMMGQPVIAGAPKEILDKIARTAGYLPFAHSDGSVASIRAVIERLRDDGAFYVEAQKLGKAYSGRFHSMPIVANLALGFYHEAIEAFYSRGAVYALLKDIGPAQVRIQRQRGHKVVEPAGKDVVMIQYLGDNAGWVLFEANGHKYKFSKLRPVQAVRQEDASVLLRVRDVRRKARGQKRMAKGKLLFRRV